MHIIKGNSLNELLINSCKAINEKGIESNSISNEKEVTTNLQIYNALLELSNPLDRYLSVAGRNSNIHALIAETMWTLSGSNIINDFLSKFLKRAKNFSDDGITWRAAYGPRIYSHDQMTCLIKELKKNPLSRQGIISIYDSNLDTKIYCEGTKDIPCNNMLYFNSEANEADKLNLHVVQRSGDVLWGTCNINVFLFTFLLEIISVILGKKPGKYTHYVINFHVYKSYDVAYSQFKSILDLDHTGDLYHFPNTINRLVELGNLIVPEDVDKTIGNIKGFFSSVIHYVNLQSWDSIEILFDSNSIPMSSKLGRYTQLIYSYLFPEEMSIESVLEKDNIYYKKLNYAVRNCQFTKFKQI